MMYHRVNPMRNPTERSMFLELGQPLPSDQCCVNITTEYWVALRCAIQTRQLYNIPEVVVQQLLNRGIKTVGGKLKMETKLDMKNRGVPSPNETDSAAIGFDLIRNWNFEYRFMNINAEGHRYFEVMQLARAKERRAENLGIVSAMLGLQKNFHPLVGESGKQEKKRKRGVYSGITSI